MKTLWTLFFAFFKLGAFSFGGGYAMIPIIESEIIEKYGWISMNEFKDILAISEMTPGPVAVNLATFLGYRVDGVLGAAIATIGVVTPSLIVMSFLIYMLNKYKESKYIEIIFTGIRPIVLGLIAAAIVSVSRGVFVDIKSVLITASIFYLVALRNFNGIYAIILAGVLGLLVY